MSNNPEIVMVSVTNIAPIFHHHFIVNYWLQTAALGAASWHSAWCVISVSKNMAKVTSSEAGDAGDVGPTLSRGVHGMKGGNCLILSRKILGMKIMEPSVNLSGVMQPTLWIL